MTSHNIVDSQYVKTGSDEDMLCCPDYAEMIKYDKRSVKVPHGTKLFIVSVLTDCVPLRWIPLIPGIYRYEDRCMAVVRHGCIYAKIESAKLDYCVDIHYILC